jgi:septum formation protein
MEAVARRRPGRLVLAADTLVVIGGKGLGKPVDAAEAADMLMELSGRTHSVLTGVALGGAMEGQARCRVDHAHTWVTFRQFSREVAEAYVATGEPMDKAGAYGIQGKGACLVDRIEGCYFNVVGLPVSLVTRMLAEFGVDIPRCWGLEPGNRGEVDA